MILIADQGNMERYIEAGLVDADEIVEIDLPTLDGMTEEDRESWRKGDGYAQERQGDADVAENRQGA